MLYVFYTVGINFRWEGKAAPLAPFFLKFRVSTFNRLHSRIDAALSPLVGLKVSRRSLWKRTKYSPCGLTQDIQSRAEHQRGKAYLQLLLSGQLPWLTMFFLTGLPGKFTVYVDVTQYSICIHSCVYVHIMQHSYIYMFVNMYIFNNIACEFIYMNTHMYRVCITQTHTHVYMLYAVALIHKQLFSCLTFMGFFFQLSHKGN